MVRMLKVFYCCCGQSLFLFIYYFFCLACTTGVIGGIIGVIGGHARGENKKQNMSFSLH